MPIPIVWNTQISGKLVRLLTEHALLTAHSCATGYIDSIIFFLLSWLGT